jgi:Domain of unknown function (DUF4177)
VLGKSQGHERPDEQDEEEAEAVTRLLAPSFQARSWRMVGRSAFLRRRHRSLDAEQGSAGVANCHHLRTPVGADGWPERSGVSPVSASVGRTLRSRRDDAGMTRYEYRSLTAGDIGVEDLDARMNEYAAEGWRLVQVIPPPHFSDTALTATPSILVFERQLHSDQSDHSDQSVTTTYP